MKQCSNICSSIFRTCNIILSNHKYKVIYRESSGYDGLKLGQFIDTKSLLCFFCFGFAFIVFFWVLVMFYILEVCCVCFYDFYYGICIGNQLQSLCIYMCSSFHQNSGYHVVKGIDFRRKSRIPCMWKHMHHVIVSRSTTFT